MEKRKISCSGAAGVRAWNRFPKVQCMRIDALSGTHLNLSDGPTPMKRPHNRTSTRSVTWVASCLGGAGVMLLTLGCSFAADLPANLFKTQAWTVREKLGLPTLEYARWGEPVTLERMLSSAAAIVRDLGVSSKSFARSS